jgi:hypothetical protein
VIAPLAHDLQACGCARKHDPKYGHTCTVHDKGARRWDSYTVDDVLKPHEIDVQAADTEWTCECGRHDEDGIMAQGTRCVWRCVSTMYDEWECQCVESFMDDWRGVQQTDWIELALQSEARP